MTPRLHRFALFCCVPLVVPLYFLPMRYKVVLAIIALFSWMARVEAATNNAATANFSDVQAACNASVNGDVVKIPAGNVAWASTLNLSGKQIFIEGSGIGQTIITDAVSLVTGSTLINWTLANNGFPAALQGIEFRGTPGQSNPNTGIVTLQGTCFMFRECSNFWNFCNNRSIQEHGWINGVHDHSFHIGNFLQFIEKWHDGYGGGSFGDVSWTDLDFSGTTNGTYLEDLVLMENSTASPGLVDMMGGARVFMRHCICSNGPATTHGTDSTGRQRSVRIFENYTNTFIERSGFNSSAGRYRGGSGVVLGNQYIGPDYQFGMDISPYREITQFPATWQAANGTNGYDLNAAGNPFDSGTATGPNGSQILIDNTKNWTVNGWTTNIIWNVTKNLASRVLTNSATVVSYDLNGPSVAGGTLLTFDNGDTYRVMAVIRALDQGGAGQSTNGFNSGSNPATPQTWPGQVLDPIYSSGNTVNGNPGMDVGSSYPSELLGRDYINGPKPGWKALQYPYPWPGLGQSSITITIPGTPILERNIKTNGTYSAFVINNGGTTNLSLFCYDRFGNTSSVKLYGTGITPLNSANGEITFTTNGNLCFLATGNGVKTAHLWEWSLDNPGGLPQNATAVTDFDLGCTNADQGFLVTMKNGSIGGGFVQHQSGSLISAIYRFGSTGVWTNYGLVDCGANSFMSSASSFATACEQPLDNSLFVFLTQDGGKAISVGQFAMTNGMVKITNGICAVNFLTNGVSVDPKAEPYGEICTANPLSNWRDTNIVVAYNNANATSVGFNSDRATQISVTNVGTNNAPRTPSISNWFYDHTVLWYTTNLTNQIIRESSSVMPTLYPVGGASGANLVTLRWLHYDTNNQTGNNLPWPIIKQSNAAGVEQTPSPPIDYTGFAGFGILNESQSFPYNGDFTYASTNNSGNLWKLVIDPSSVPSPPPPGPGPEVVVAGNLTVTGNMTIK